MYEWGVVYVCSIDLCGCFGLQIQIQIQIQTLFTLWLFGVWWSLRSCVCHVKTKGFPMHINITSKSPSKTQHPNSLQTMHHEKEMKRKRKMNGWNGKR